jgi:hypothetical protein
VAIGSVIGARRVAYTVALVPVGVATLLLLRCANSTVQLAAADAIWERLMGVYPLVSSTAAQPAGPLHGLVDARCGPRFGMLLAWCQRSSRPPSQPSWLGPPGWG